MNELFTQSPPQLGNQYRDDQFLRDYLRRVLPEDVLRDVEPDLDEMGSIGGGELYQLQLADRLNEPRLVQWDAWGNRIDRIELTPLWQKAAPIAASRGLIAIPYEQRHARFSRIHQFASVYLFHPSSDVYTCPLAMTDGAARTLLSTGNKAIADRAVPRLTSRDPASAWTSGQWMTETTGGSDVGLSETRATPSSDGKWTLHGKKWFTSAATSEMTLTLARPDGNGPGGSGLALFYLETRDAAGKLNGIRIERLKDKLGTRKVPTAELMLDGTVAEAVIGTTNGTRNIAPMLQITRAWNSVTATAFMRRACALAQSYSKERKAFGALLADLPLHRETLADIEMETRAATLLAFELVELIGRDESGDIDEEQRALLRLVTPIAKLVTAKQTVAAVSEAIEAFGGAGYVEDTGLPVLLRDSQVLPIWEGTTNVLSLDAMLRADLAGGLHALRGRVLAAIQDAPGELGDAGAVAVAAIEHATSWATAGPDPRQLQGGARRFALTLGRALELALMIEHAAWAKTHDGQADGVALAQRFAQTRIDQIL
ncbi:MAG TPA: acyl-CoA dehydrogenase family protein [Candidatus Limnocylindrales bacterium]|nr:acyl-CoA dehydrogenase family protein [Candidatus Limnocylindrales bacterium]